MTVYVFDLYQRVRAVLGPNDAVDLIHDENNHTITISVKRTYQVKNGEYIGFHCVDGHFRLFCVTISALDESRNVHDITATDAIIQEMKEIIIEDKQQLDVNLRDALSGLVPDAAWTITGDAPDRLEKSRAYFKSLWQMVTTFETLYEWAIDAYYEYSDGQITAKVLHMHDAAPVFRGRIFESGKDASKVYITRTGRPITRLYGLGPAQGSQDEPENLTFADAVWSVANGDPVDKPLGQTWVEDPEAVAEQGLHTDTFPVNEAEDAQDLLKKTWEELQRRKQPSVNIKATVADMEMVPGYSHMQIRLGDLAAVLLKDGSTVEAKIIAIKRHYFRPNLTTITIGEKTASIQTQVSALFTDATHTFERLTIYKNRFREDEALIQLNAEHIQLNATTIIEHAEQILLKAEAEDLAAVQLLIDSINNQIQLQAGTIELQAQEIALKADKTYVDNLVAQYVTAEELEAEVLTVVDSAYVLGLLSGEMIDANSIVAASVNTEWLSADSIGTDSLSTGALSIGGSELVKKEKYFVTSLETTSYDGYVTGVKAITDKITYYE